MPMTSQFALNYIALLEENKAKLAKNEKIW
jgi:hypothetical protein